MELNQLKEEDFKKIMEYTADCLIKQVLPVRYDNGYLLEAVPNTTILSLPTLVKLSDFLNSRGEKKARSKAAPVDDDKGFSAFWKVYPATCNFKHKGMIFTGSRVLRSNYTVCQNLYLNALSERPDLTPELLFKALEIQLKMAKDESVQNGVNKLQYWNGLEVYLRQGKYEPFIEMAAGNDLFEDSDDSVNDTENCA